MTAQFHQAAPVFLDMAFRAAPDGSSIFEGYAAVFDTPSRPITDKWGVDYIETFAPGSFKRTLSSGRRQTFVVDHDERLFISSTRSGKLRLAEDSKGLITETPWPNTDYANNVRALYDAGEQLGMSVHYGVHRSGSGDTWDVQRKNHRVTEAVLAHVTVTTWQTPAFAETTAGFRSLAQKTEADVEDIEDLVEALKDGRELNENERSLLTRLAAAVAPAGEAAVAQPQEVDPKLTVAFWTEQFKGFDL